jgi:integrase
MTAATARGDNGVLTELGIKGRLAKLPATRTEVPDGKGLGLYLVIQPSGAVSWALRYRAEGTSRKLTLGRYPALGLAMARKRAAEALGEVAVGKDPARAKTAARAAAKAETDRIERVVELFVERYAKSKTRDWRETERMLIKEVAGRWKGKRLSEITRSQVNAMLDEIVDRGAPIRANRVFAQLRKMCKWAIGRGIIERSPCDGVTPPSQENKRERVLDDGEIKRVWEAAEALAWPFGPIVKLVLLTGARRDEVAGMRWSEINLRERSWTIPKERSKNDRAHMIPLSDTAIAVLESLPRIGDRVDFVFSTTGRTAVSGFSRMKANIDAAIAERLREEAAARGDEPNAMPDWILHDLRRTLATNLQKLGVRLEVTEAVLNHVSGSRAGVVGVYQRHDWAAEKRQALDAWARRLGAIVRREGTSNVVEMRAGQNDREEVEAKTRITRAGVF